MKLAIISDIHSNLHALEAVKEAIDRAGTDEVVCAGDVVGYGAFPNECCQIVRKLASNTVLGNHDLACLRRDPSRMNPYAAKAILWTADRLNDESQQFIHSLREEHKFAIEGVRFSMFHGSPSSVDEYVFEQDVDESLVEAGGGDVLILGHTHVPLVMRLRTGLFVNPGAVGQPRDGEWKASYAVFDTETRKCEVKREEYDLQAAAEAIRSAGLPGLLAERLFYGT